MLDELHIFQTIILPLLGHMLRELVITSRAGHVWFRGEDAVFAATVFGTNGLDETRLKRLELAGVSG